VNCALAIDADKTMTRLDRRRSFIEFPSNAALLEKIIEEEIECWRRIA
jgi:hypothetical protein